MMIDPDVVEDHHAAWQALAELLTRSFAAPRILPADQETALASVRQLHVAASSPLGALALNSGGILLHDGWLRIFGGSPSPDECLPSILEVNDFPAAADDLWVPIAGLIVAHDVLGGVFFLNGLRPAAGRPGVPGEVIYFDPSSLRWRRMRMSHGEWLDWCLSGDLPHFYNRRLWPGWREDVLALRADQGIVVSAPPGGGQELAAADCVTRTVGSMADILARQLDAVRLRGRRLDGFLGRYPPAVPAR
ncbi:DUF2625 family protein [Actinoplanes sp. NPDC048988]|uniref:DUF2625 family protein n=1 Tax=Actinoplanes sp. NPDC048988 TaxID=3363901 RepID=UPI00371E16B7